MLCPAQNLASIPLLQFARRYEWMALHALTAQCLIPDLPDILAALNANNHVRYAVWQLQGGTGGRLRAAIDPRINRMSKPLEGV